MIRASVLHCFTCGLRARDVSNKDASPPVGKRRVLCPGAFAIAGTGVRSFNWSSEASTLCQRALSFFVSIAAERSEWKCKIRSRRSGSVRLNLRSESWPSNCAYVSSVKEYSAAAAGLPESRSQFGSRSESERISLRNARQHRLQPLKVVSIVCFL